MLNMDKSKYANPKEINIIIKKGKRNKPQEAKVEKKEEKIVKKNNNILNKKPKNKNNRHKIVNINVFLNLDFTGEKL